MKVVGQLWNSFDLMARFHLLSQNLMLNVGTNCTAEKSDGSAVGQCWNVFLVLRKKKGIYMNGKGKALAEGTEENNFGICHCYAVSATTWIVSVPDLKTNRNSLLISIGLSVLFRWSWNCWGLLTCIILPVASSMTRAKKYFLSKFLYCRNGWLFCWEFWN